MQKMLYALVLWLPLVTTAQQGFQVTVQEVSFTGLPSVQSFAVGTHGGLWLLVGGRADGLHQRQPFASFLAEGNNTQMHVVDRVAGQVWSVALSSLPTSVQEQLQSTNMAWYQRDTVLYLVGGYGYSATAADHITHGRLTALNIPGCVAAVQAGGSLAPHVRSVADSRMAVTGGNLGLIGSTFHLVGGQYFEGRYNPMGPNHGPGFIQEYTEAVRRFGVNDDGTSLAVVSYTETSDPAELHRRDNNMLPQIFPDGSFGYTAFSGVFQPTVDLPWLNTVNITATGHQAVAGFNQMLSQYHSAKMAVHDASSGRMHSLFFGGMSRYRYDAQGNLITDDAVPFVNTISVVTRTTDGTMTELQLPQTMPGLLGAGAEFIPAAGMPYLPSGILDLAALPMGPQVVGHILGGIESTADNIFFVNNGTQSHASTRLFEVVIEREETTAVARPVRATDVLQLHVAPNPASNELQFTVRSLYPAQGTALLVATDGRTVLSQALWLHAAGAQPLSMPLRHVAPGNYLLRVCDTGFCVDEPVSVLGQ
jgi:hypothetical protein